MKQVSTVNDSLRQMQMLFGSSRRLMLPWTFSGMMSVQDRRTETTYT